MKVNFPSFLWPLKVASGHLNAVIDMYENGKDEDTIIFQLFAIRGAIDKLLMILVQKRIRMILGELEGVRCTEAVEYKIQRIMRLFHTKQKVSVPPQRKNDGV